MLNKFQSLFSINEFNRKWWILIALSTMVVMANIDMTAVNIALPAIGYEFHASLSSLQWVINTYILVTAMFTIVGGKLGDIISHRKIFIIGVIVFASASLLCGIAINENILIMSRAIQGGGAALAFPMMGVIIFAAFPPEQKGFAIGIFGATSGFVQSIGPTVGGAIVKYMSWHWIFFLNLPISIICVFLLMLSCPKNIIPAVNMKIDYRGIIFLSIGLFLLTYAINELQYWNFFSSLFLGMIFASVCFLGLFVFFSRNNDQSLINLSLFKNKAFVILNLLRFISVYCFFVILFIFVLCLQNILLIDPIKTGLYMLFMTVIFGLLSPVGGKLVDIFGARRPLLVAFVILAISCILFAILRYSQSLVMIIIPLFLMGLSLGIIFPATNIAVLQVVKDGERGAANGLYMTINMLGGVFGVAVSGAMDSVLGNNFLQSGLQKLNYHLSEVKVDMLQQIVNGAHSIADISKYFSSEIASNLMQIAKEAFFYSFYWVMLSCAVLTFIGLVLLLLPKSSRV